MVSRAAAILVALVLVVATGMGRSVSYLCLMDGQVRSACCCKKTESQAESDCPKVERQGCCEVRVAEAAKAPATARDGVHNEQLPGPPALASLSPRLDVVPPSSRDFLPGIGARGPPSGTGPPIFVRNCSYLI